LTVPVFATQLTERLLAPVQAVTRGDVRDQFTDWLGDALSSIVSIVVIVVVALIVLRLLRSAVQRVVARVLDRQDQSQRELRQKAQTLANVIESAGRLVVFILAGIMILGKLGLDIAPLIASAGVAGLAIGLGAQSLIRDTINGFFILFENQFAVGDAVRIGESSGSVEEVNLRRTVLRSVNGAAIIIPNGEVRVVQNLSKGWSRAVIDVTVAADTDAGVVIDLLHSLLDHAQDDPLFGAQVLEPPEILGVTAIDLTGVTFRVLVKTLPLQQWPVERELRRRIWQAFREHGISMPTAMLAPQAPPPGQAT
jgi:moderate conductance mechanosensitive channel